MKKMKTAWKVAPEVELEVARARSADVRVVDRGTRRREWTKGRERGLTDSQDDGE